MSASPATVANTSKLARLQVWLARHGWRARSGVIAVPYFWLLLFFLVPFAIVLKIAFSDTRLGSPPYEPLLQWAGDKVLQLQLNLGNFMFLVEDNLYWKAYLNSLGVAAISTALCLVIGYPMAYALARTDRRWRNGLLMLVVLPFWTSLLLRVYAWIGLLRDEGLINSALLALGVIREPIVMLQTDFAIYVGIVYSYLPFMILPLYANLEKMDLTLLEAAADLGCRPLRAFFTITVPLSMPGVVAGSLLVFIPAVGEYVIPELLGAPDALMIGKVLAGEFFRNRDWPVASAVAIALLLVLLLPLVFLQRAQAAEGEQRSSDTARPWPVRSLIGAALLTALGVAWWLLRESSATDLSALLSLLAAPASLLAVIVALTGLCFAVLTIIVRRFQVRLSAFNVSALLAGFAFLYVPILSMIVFSFNDSRLITSWAGFSLRWYQRLFENEQILSTAGLSLQIATINATGAVILGTLAGLALARFGPFKGRTLFVTMTTAPLVMPEVITGLSLLLLFIAMEQLFGWPAGRGVTTVTIAHMTLTMAYVTVIVRSRLASLDESLEEAAMDLGARPARIFFVITLPIIAPALASGWLLAFTISLDDVVLASFVSGPGSSTLPLLIFSKMRLGITPDINALGAILVLLVTVGVVIAAILSARTERRRVTDMQLAAAENP